MRAAMRRQFLMGSIATALALISRDASAQPHPIPDLQPPHGELPPSFWEQHGWQLAVAAVATLLIVILVIAWWRRPRVVMIEPPAIIARRELNSLLGRKEDEALAVEVSYILRRYLKDRLALTSAEMTTAEFGKTLQGRTEIAPALAAAAHDFLRRCDEWKFAPAPPALRLNAVTDALEIVEKIETAENSIPSPVATK
jgi:hypothetical protein